MSVPRNSWGDPIKSTSTSGEPVWGDAEATPGAEGGRAGTGDDGALIKGRLTQREAQALDSMEKQARLAALSGNLLGGTLTWLYLANRKPPSALPRKFVLSFAGGLVIGTAAFATSVYTNEKKLGDKIESKAHLRDTLQEMKKRMTNDQVDFKTAEAEAKRGQLGGSERGGGGAAAAAAWEDRTGGGKETGSYGGDFPASGSSPRQGPPPAPAPSYSSGSYNSNNDPFSTPSQGQSGSNDESNGGSRWAQLRAERGQAPSAWERLRQDNGRDNIRQQQQSSSFGSGSDDGSRPLKPAQARTTFTRGGDPGLADPTFGKGSTSNEREERRAFEAAFDRESRGMDGQARGAGSRAEMRMS